MVDKETIDKLRRSESLLYYAGIFVVATNAYTFYREFHALAFVIVCLVALHSIHYGHQKAKILCDLYERR